MKQLTVKQLKSILNTMPENAKIYLGDDEELNGIHGAYFAQEVSKDDIVSLSYGEFDNSAILIS